MAEEQTNEEFNYCDSDEEVFIGNVTDKERAVMAKFGQDFFSPTVSTPIDRASSRNQSDYDFLVLASNQIEGNSEGKDNKAAVLPDEDNFSTKSIDAEYQTDNRDQVVIDNKLKHRLSMNESEFLNAISDSVLNNTSISLSRSINDAATVNSLVDGDNSIVVSSAQRVDLHMSVDEPDCQQSIPSLQSDTGSVPSLFMSCFDSSSLSSYHTACNTLGEPVKLQTAGDSFNSYRDALNVTLGDEGINTAIDSNEELNEQNETSFEIVAKNRKNSFTEINQKADNPLVEKETVKPKTFSKLPVLSHSTKLLMRPPKLTVNPSSDAKSNYKWAKNLQTADSEQNRKKGPSSITNRSQINPCKNKNNSIVKDFTNFPNSISKSKTPAKNTPLMTLKSDNKTPSSSASMKYTKSSNKKVNTQISQVSMLPRKDLFKYVKSPVRAYIGQGTPVLVEKKIAPETVRIAVSESGSKTKFVSNLPVLSHTPRPVQKQLQFQTLSGQENVDPNYTRDTLPSRVLQSATAVLLKEPQPKMYLPKVGSDMQKLLDTPKPKLVLHQGRIKQSPSTKGALVSSTVTNEQDFDISVRITKSAGISNKLT